MTKEFIDVNNLIGRFTLAELNQAADDYWKRLTDNPRLRAKPFNLGDAEHMLPRLGFLIQGLQPYAGMTVLDFGAGSCYASRILNQMQLRVISADVSRTALEVGKQIREICPPLDSVPEHIFLPFDGYHLDLPAQSVDRIICIDALHHVPDQDLVLREMGRVLRDGGVAGFAEPGPNHSSTAEAQLEMRSWNVIENDIVLEKLFENARKYGFTDLKICMATIHPPLVPLEESAGYFTNPVAFIDSVQNFTTNYPIFFLYKGDPTIRDSRAPEGLCAAIVPSCHTLECSANVPARFNIDVTNTSAKKWLASGLQIGSVNVGGVLRSQNRPELSCGREYRFSLSTSEVEPNSTMQGVEVNLGNLEPGEYSLDVDLVSEHICWFQSQSNTMVTIDIIVRPN